MNFKPHKDFKEQNDMLVGRGEIPNLPIHRGKLMVSSCWRIPFFQRVRMLFTGKVFLHAMGRTHPPVYLSDKM